LRFGSHEDETLRYTDIPYSALGMMLGFDEEAERLFKLQFLMARRRRNYAYHKGSHYPVFTFMIRVLADYLEVGPWIVEDNEEAAKIFNPLFDAWRDAGTEMLAPLCLAACDYHTWETRREGFGTTEEFSNGSWNRTPIEILLIFELRRRLGLPNPVLDHPLMGTPLAILPKGSRPPTSEMLQRVWARMREEGFDESQMLEWLRERPSVAARCLPVIQGVVRGHSTVPSQAAVDNEQPKQWWKFW
jgi:hypothetical protein